MKHLYNFGLYLKEHPFLLDVRTKMHAIAILPNRSRMTLTDGKNAFIFVLVVSIGVNRTFKVIFTPLEYIPTLSKTLHFFGLRFLLCTNTSIICYVLFKWKEGPQQNIKFKIGISMLMNFLCLDLKGHASRISKLV